MSLDAVAAALSLPVTGRPLNDGVVIGERVFGVADGVDDGVGTGKQALLEVVRLLGSRPRPRDLRPALHAANFALWFRAEDAVGLIATVTVAVWCGTRVAIGHVGDSRAYLIRDGLVEQLTTDQARMRRGDGGVVRLGDHQAVPAAEVRLVKLAFSGDGDQPW